MYCFSWSFHTCCPVLPFIYCAFYSLLVRSSYDQTHRHQRLQLILTKVSSFNNLVIIRRNLNNKCFIYLYQFNNFCTDFSRSHVCHYSSSTNSDIKEIGTIQSYTARSSPNYDRKAITNNYRKKHSRHSLQSRSWEISWCNEVNGLFYQWSFLSSVAFK